MSVTTAVDVAETLVEGPWRHRFVAANGARFHVAEAGDGDAPLVLLLHGFPQFWWAWRHQLPALADAGYRVAAMDLRGYAASDKPPRGYDTRTLCADVGGVIRSLGAGSAVVVGHDWGAFVAWAMPSLRPRQTAAIGVLSMGHPLAMRSLTVRRGGRSAAGQARLLAFQAPVLPELSFTEGDGVARVLADWAAPGYPDEATAQRYTRAMQLPFVAHSALEYYRWAVRSLVRSDGRRFAAAVAQPVRVPVLQLHGALDPWVPPHAATASQAWAAGPLSAHLVPGAGHFLPEEAPGAVTEHLLRWLPGVTHS